MRVLGLDLETTGFDTANDRITEVGAVLWDVETKRPLGMNGIFFIDDGIRAKMQQPEIAEMTSRVCGITLPMLEEFGLPPGPSLEALGDYCTKHGVEYIVAHNGENYDKPLLLAELSRLGVGNGGLRDRAWIDTRTDIPFAVEPNSRKLKHLAVDHGFINPFAHRAVFDVLTMLRVLSNYPIADVLAYQKLPFVLVRAVVSYDDRAKAKDMRYSWEKIGEETYPKMWVKKVKENLLDAEIAACAAKGFQAVRIK